MSLWKKMATPASGTAAIVAAAACWNQLRQAVNPSVGTSDTSGKEVTTLASASGALAASQASASPW
jgi:hypothetical protein